MKRRDGYHYLLIGSKKEYNNESILIFDLTSAVPHKTKYVEKEDSIEKIGISYFDEYYAYHYGRNIYEDETSTRLYLIVLFKSWGEEAKKAPLEKEDGELGQKQSLVIT